MRRALHSSKVLPFPFSSTLDLSITYTNDVLDEFNVKMTVSKSGTTFKILQHLAEPSEILQKCCSSFRFL